MLPVSKTWLDKYIFCNGIRFHYIEEGEGPLIILLHGFPENHYSWRYQISPFSKNFRVVAPDLRGYHLTDHQGPYDIKTLSKDVCELIHQLGYEKAIMIGHDWGALIMWNFALDYPDMCVKLVSLNTPYLPRGSKPLHEILTDSRFDYMRDFQIPGRAEKLIEADIDGFMVRVLSNNAVHKDFITGDLLTFFSDSFRKPGSITPPLEYYRNLTLNWELTKNHSDEKIKIPTLMIVADHDPILKPEMSLGIEDNFVSVTVIHFDCGHWTQQELPEETNHAILNFLMPTRHTTL